MQNEHLKIAALVPKAAVISSTILMKLPAGCTEPRHFYASVLHMIQALVSQAAAHPTRAQIHVVLAQTHAPIHVVLALILLLAAHHHFVKKFFSLKKEKRIIKILNGISIRKKIL